MACPRHRVANDVTPRPNRFVRGRSLRSSTEQLTRTPILIVSDLDGTMVGNDEYTRAFRQFWESSAKPPGSKLVYSTGRSLESFTRLIEAKADVLVQPDGLICAVGTKVFQRASDDASTAWTEDVQWTAALDVNWSCELVTRAAQEAIDACGHENAHFQPADEQNRHKVTIGVRDEIVSEVETMIRQACDSNGLDYTVIVSGSGGWKFVDCVSAGAGKLESLEYVRKRLGFELLDTVACGDSGNDILMLSGQTRCIIVGNAESELRDWASECVANGELSLERVFLASENEALGILQGLAKFGFCC
ncbi:HAD-superfamily hydrolase, subfamily IIB [Ostreococcus tauri]|uniref:HAD-superfamily hydrolase, subfamily IIB n=1 Tax=Ostreococcus tauri TaxID=70448 RepID=Q01GF9_OSTTA|nr:HAD-superfamily hydrolase, subfamily IIB [Ostreococcus tauri]OUS42677.1 sucrose-phosphate synthase [Ostreococcus tauri]CAL50185.1 HAD-superfamily hydrolase, subfamily IIB [Ostreococcus tauri]|eukprot:XP_003074334.1 HAD-superfamily hydrolase, subfamily IIB [Ostreococcus tauri]